MIGFRDSSDFADFAVNLAWAIAGFVNIAAAIWLICLGYSILNECRAAGRDVAAMRQDVVEMRQGIKAIRGTVAP